MSALAEAMVKDVASAPIAEAEPAGENDRIPAGYTYFGQFVDHDISFDPTPLGVQQVDRDALRQGRGGYLLPDLK